jgi:hypothetical protein
MKRVPEHHGQRWTADQDAHLRELAEHNKPTRLMARELGRTPEAVFARASELDISLKPVNQSPYGPRRRP